MADGYHDEEVMGKPYDARLVRRLVKYVRPYLSQVAIAVFILIFVAAAELALPYITRTAIDDYIVATSRVVTVGDDPSDFARAFLSEHKDDLAPLVSGLDGAREAYVVRSKAISGYDPRDVVRATDEGLLGEVDYYLADEAAASRAGLELSEYPRTDQEVLVPVSELSELSPEQSRELRERDFRGVGRIALLMVAILAVSFGLSVLQINMMEATSQRVMYDIRMTVLRHLQRLSLAFFDKNPVGRLVTRATNDVQVLHEMFTSIVIMLLRDMFVLLGVVILLLKLNWRLALVSFAVLPFMAWATVVFSVRIRDAFREVRIRVARINASLQENIGGMLVTQIFRREPESYARFARINHLNFLAAMRQIKVFASFMPLMELASAIAIALVIWYGGGKVLRSTLSLGTLVAFLSYVQMFFRPIRNLAQQYGTMQQAMASSERIFLLLDNDNIIPDPEHPRTLEEVEGRIAFENVTFSYDGEEKVLCDLSFTVEPGETVAIVGATGAGKTSIISLIERFYDIQDGRITLDGVDIREMEKSYLRSHLGLVMQDVFLFAGDIKGNIRLGNDEIPEERIREMARYVHADRFIEKLPDVYDEEVHERGSTLSTGQRQLLAFARALAFDPKILILDEATSNIDTETEHLIQDALVRLMEGRTSIVIAHRLSTIQHADKILVMHKGRIREEGTHQELLARRGYYYRLYELQYSQ
ncbi:MAG: ATP-binding cassette domain-containing protein [Candidatus Eisenbacteria bacterium]|nr:ATP-binding cassette domain-containing protein [Candidatus Eisenbacteria bacterium]